MDTMQEIKKNEDLIKSLDSKRTDIFTFMAKEIKGNHRLEKAVSDLATVNGALEKAYTAKGELEKAAAQEQADLEKAQKEKEALEKAQEEQEKEALEKAKLEKAKDELNNEICESMRAEKEFTDEYVKELADKYSMSVDDIEDAIAAAIEANGGAEA